MIIIKRLQSAKNKVINIEGIQLHDSTDQMRRLNRTKLQDLNIQSLHS